MWILFKNYNKDNENEDEDYNEVKKNKVNPENKVKHVIKLKV